MAFKEKKKILEYCRSRRWGRSWSRKLRFAGVPYSQALQNLLLLFFQRTSILHHKMYYPGTSLQIQLLSHWLSSGLASFGNKKLGEDMVKTIRRPVEFSIHWKSWKVLHSFGTLFPWTHLFLAKLHFSELRNRPLYPLQGKNCRLDSCIRYIVSTIVFKTILT